MKKALFCIILFIISTQLFSQNYSIISPDKTIKLSVDIFENVSFNIEYKGSLIIENSTIDIGISGQYLFSGLPKVILTTTSYVRDTIIPVVAQKSSVIVDEYNELIIYFDGDYQLIFRTYNDGTAYRICTSFTGDVIVDDEAFNLNLTEGSTSLFPEEHSMISHNERLYIPTKLDTLPESTYGSLPVLLRVKDVNILFTEADLYDYPGMFMAGINGNGLKAKFPNYVEEAIPKNGSDRNQFITTASYLAKTSGTRNYPWRVMIISDKDKDLIESNLIFQLSRPLEIEEIDWIIPGKVAWDWYNANNIYGVDFEAGINTETYHYYIDFASEYGLEYVILDEGWSMSTTIINESNPDINIAELIAHGNEKNVGIILWVLWEPLDKKMDVMKIYNSWGVKGIKVDFMQRSDQYMVNYYERVAKEAAKNNLLVDFHGAFKPSGLRRAYPNVLTYEGVKGNENNKWSALITPEHNVTIPFIRMVAGPMDYTPGAMHNRTAANHIISWNRPSSIGTRCHQVAMYVVYESPLQMLCESPSTYYKEEETTRFISKIPTTWDETIVLDAKVADYILIARRRDDNWYIGAMTDSSPRELEIDFPFLGDGTYEMELMRDGKNSDKFAQDYIIETGEVNKSTKLKIELAPGGGFSAIISKK